MMQKAGLVAVFASPDDETKELLGSEAQKLQIVICHWGLPHVQLRNTTDTLATSWDWFNGRINTESGAAYQRPVKAWNAGQGVKSACVANALGVFVDMFLTGVKQNKAYWSNPKAGLPPVEIFREDPNEFIVKHLFKKINGKLEPLFDWVQKEISGGIHPDELKRVWRDVYIKYYVDGVEHWMPT